MTAAPGLLVARADRAVTATIGAPACPDEHVRVALADRAVSATIGAAACPDEDARVALADGPPTEVL